MHIVVTLYTSAAADIGEPTQTGQVGAGADVEVGGGVSGGLGADHGADASLYLEEAIGGGLTRGLGVSEDLDAADGRRRRVACSRRPTTGGLARADDTIEGAADGEARLTRLTLELWTIRGRTN